MLQAIDSGLELAGLAKGMAPAQDLAEQVTARIVSDAILGGQGFEVVKLKAALIAGSKSQLDDDDKPGAELSPLMRALSACPGMDAGTVPAPMAGQVDANPRGALDAAPGTYTRESVVPENPGVVAPFFSPQLALDLGAPAAAELAEPPRGVAPTPPAALPPESNTPTRKIFENLENPPLDGEAPEPRAA